MYSQANVRVGKCAAAPYPSVAVRDGGHWKGVAGSGWVRGAGRGKTARGWKGVRPGVRFDSRSGELVRSPKNTSAMSGNFIDWVKSALVRSARLMNSQTKGPKRMVTKVQWLCWRRMSNTKERWDQLYATHQIHDNWVAYSRIWAAEVFIDFTEELKHTETDPMCKIHESCCTSRRHSRPKSFARNDSPRWTSSA